MPDIVKAEPLPGFPEHAGLINQQEGNGFALRHHKPLVMENTATVDTGEDPKKYAASKVLDFTVTVPVFNAVLLVAPYVRLTQCVTERFMKWFRRAKLTLELDGCRILWNSPVRHHLAVPKDRRLDDYPFDIDQEPDWIFPAGRLKDGNVFWEDGYGIFLPNESVVRVMLTGIPGGEGKVPIEAGCVAAEYTTRETPGPKDWSPRPEGFMIRRRKSS